MHFARTPLSLALASVLSAAACAQDAANVVTVTAQGRTQQLQNVPIAVQVITNEQINKLGAPNLAGVSAYTPGLSVDAGQPTQPFFAIRGIGSGDFGIGTDAPVGVYVDGVYTGKTGGALLNFNDVKRIEVLKGPQGIIFGRNSAGGAISVVTQEPTAQREARGLLRVGNHGLAHSEVMLNQPLGDDLALRFSAVTQHSNGWLTDAATGERAMGEHAWGTRLALKWSASDATSAVLSWEHEELNQHARPAIGLVAAPPLGTPPPFPADPQSFLDPRRAPLYNDVDDKEARRFNGLTLRIEHELPWAQFTSTTAYRHFTSLNRQDNDGTNRILTYLDTANIEANTTWQQEFRLSGKSARLDWLVGASLFHEKADQTSQVNTFTDTLDTLFNNVAGLPVYSTVNGLAALAGVPGIDLLGNPWQESMINHGTFKAYALYGDTIWHLTPATNLTAGIRFTRDDKRFSWFSPLRNAAGLDSQLAVLDAASLFPALVAAGALTQAQADQIQALMTTNQLLNGQGASSAPFTVQRAWNDVSPRLVIDHRHGPDLMTYASITRGYQSGGFNALQVNGAFEPERVTSLELGAKGQWRDLAFSAALFRYRFNNLQSLQLVPSGNQAGVPAYQVEVSDQKATGLDLEGRWQLTPAVRLFGAAEYIDQVYGQHRSSFGTDLSGQPVGTPRWTAMAGIDTRWVAANGIVNVTLQTAYTGATRCNDDSVAQGTCLDVPAFKVGEARQRVDASVGWERTDKRFGVGLIVNNLLGKRYVNNVSYQSASIGAPYATISPPRSVALVLKASL